MKDFKGLIEVILFYLDWIGLDCCLSLFFFFFFLFLYYSNYYDIILGETNYLHSFISLGARVIICIVLL